MIAFICDLPSWSAFCGGRQVEGLQRETQLPFANTSPVSQNTEAEVEIKHSGYSVI